ncbi:WRKY Transcription Factor [Ranunculus cassubicifolius]
MCSLFTKSQQMEKDRGDLADIVRASGGGGVNGDNQANWRIPSEVTVAANFPAAMEEPMDEFGDPYSNMHDPLLHELQISNTSSNTFFDRSSNPSGTSLINRNSHLPRPIFEEENIRRPTNNIFPTRMLQISPNSSTVMASSSPRVGLLRTDTVKSNTSSIEGVGMMQISSARNPGIKRRKSQAKKVVCIPAPAAANSSRPSGEVVPSDLWAWRKYGQKPIKGSPYPRGYYRCSSSKGCSARKQVERSRTDPNMLVITYTSEHNHPWPTQRNALAGSTRSQPPKNSNGGAKNMTSNKHIMKEEPKESVSINVVDGSINVSTVKEEILQEEKPSEFDHFHQNYRPPPPADLESNLQPDDFFADLVELDCDPLNLLFSEGISGEKGGGGNKALDPFSLFDWAGNNNMFGENKRGGL